MQEANKSILNSVKNQQYFIDAKNWYLFKYVNPSVDRFFISIILSFFILSLLIVLYFYDTLISVNSQIEYLSMSKDINKYYSKISPLGDSEANPQELLEEYLCKIYLTKRESYNYNEIENQTKYVVNNSSNEVAKQYSDYISINNPDSPILLLGEYTIRKINIDSIQKNPKELKSYLISYTANEFFQKTGKKEISKWLAKVNYDVDLIDNMMKNNDKHVNFRVKSYNVKKIE